MDRQLIGTIQRAVDRRMRARRLYCRPIETVLQMYTAQQGMIGSLSMNPADSDTLGRLVGELLVESISLANQYHISLVAAYRSHGLDSDLERILEQRRSQAPPPDPLELVLRIGRGIDEMARAVAFYEHDAESVNERTNLTRAVPAMHSALMEFCTRLDLDIRSVVKRSLDATQRIPHTLPFNPIDAPCLGYFKPVQEQTLCPFARTAKLWGAPDYDGRRSFVNNVRSALPHLYSFTKAAQAEVLDGFLFAFPTVAFGEEFETVPSVVRSLLTALVLHDPRHPGTIEPGNMTDESWRFRFAGEEFFVNVFAPQYADHHSRYTYRSRDHIFVLLQPETSFHAHIPKADHEARRREIRRIFDQSFQGYVLDDVEAHRFILARDHDGPPVRWYQAPTLAEEAS